MRREQRRIIIEAGFDPHRTLRDRYLESAICRVWLIDGRVAALGGICGSLLSPYGAVWLVLSEDITAHPVAVARQARRQLAEVMTTYRELATVLVGDDPPARRLAAFLGFHIGHGGPGGRAGSRRERVGLADFIRDEPSLRVPIGNSYGVVMGFHEDPG